MRITEISIRIGETVNLGDYSNFRPEIGVTATIEPFDEPDEVFAELTDDLARRLGVMVDDALEQAGRQPKYTTELYKVRLSELRQVVVIARRGIDLPQENNWRDKDHWLAIGDGDLPLYMRFETAQKAATAAAMQNLYGILVVRHPDELTLLPPLPDPGLEPSWSIKKLASGLTALRIPKEAWEQVGELPHVDVAYLDNFYAWYRRTSRYLRDEQMVDMFLAGDTPWANAAASQPDEEE